MTLRKLLRTGVAALMFAPVVDANPSHAGSVAAWPIRIHLDADGSASQIEVNNPSEEAAYIQAVPVHWHPGKPMDTATIAHDLIVVPPVFELGPDTTQIVRLALRNPIEDGSERAFRLLITEVPRTAGLVPNTLAIAARMNLPVLATPSGAVPSPTWTIRLSPLKKPELVVNNEGSSHFVIRSVKVLPEGSDEIAFSREGGGYVLAGQEKRWPIDVGIDKLQRPLKVQVETSTGVVEAPVTLSNS